MASNAKLFRDYIRSIQANLALGNATEHTHRSALKLLLESVGDRVTATNEPKRIECGAPDFVITKLNQLSLTVGYVEAKDIGIDLELIDRDSERKDPSTDNGKQINRYRMSLPNFLLTNYTEFRWYVNGELRMDARLDVSKGHPSWSQAEYGKLGQLIWGFLERGPERIASPVDLARRMARLTHMIRDTIGEGFKLGHVSQDVQELHEATKRVLVPDLTEETFADMFSQTLAYGLFAARVNHVAGPFRRQDAAYRIPPTNPFLQNLFTVIAGPSIDNEPFVCFVDDLTQLLGNADIEAILSDFGKRVARQDPILHFYETFLAAYDPKLRIQRGVYYTPDPVVSYIVSSVDWLLREFFNCSDGLADYTMISCDDADGNNENSVKKHLHRVLVLDPACGTGTFLYAIIDHIRSYYRRSGNAGMWSEYVKEHLLNRVFGFELLMAPYAMSHLKLGMQLSAQDMPIEERQNWLYEFYSNERLGVYLTNSLEQAESQTMTLFGPLRVITEEANAAAEIKRDLPIMVVLGNPPYSGHSANASKKDGEFTWIGKLIEDYKKVDGNPLDEQNTKWLQDDYVKFIRFGQRRIEQTGAGILAFITNNAYLDNPTFRGMRQQLMDTFSKIFILDLHGNANKREIAPEGGPDENVFDIRQGVSIVLFVKEENKNKSAVVNHADLWGTRVSKYKALAESDVSITPWTSIEPVSPFYMFKPWNSTLEEEYYRWPKITEIMPINSLGIVTARDKLTLHWSRSELMETVRDFAHLPPDTARDKYDLGEDTRDWKINLAQADLVESGQNPSLVTTLLYRPFDARYTYYTGQTRGFLCMPRSDVMRHMLAGANLALITTRQTHDPWAALATNSLIGHKSLAAYDSNSLFPLYLYPSDEETAPELLESTGRWVNFAPNFVSNLEENLRLRYTGDGAGDLQECFGPEDVFHYIYSVFHSPTYRKRYVQFLRVDFPRIPFINDVGLFRELVGLGRQLTSLHLMNSPTLDNSKISFPVSGDNVIEKGHPKYISSDSWLSGQVEQIEQGRVYISKDNKRSNKRGQYFEGISPDIWESRFGGYQPMKKWLKERRGKSLSFDDLNHYRRLGAAMSETGRLMQEIDAAIGDARSIFIQQEIN